jgi:hypothetical protein
MTWIYAGGICIFEGRLNTVEDVHFLMWVLRFVDDLEQNILDE